MTAALHVLNPACVQFLIWRTHTAESAGRASVVSRLRELSETTAWSHPGPDRSVPTEPLSGYEQAKAKLR
jgi:hypothetical protein